MRGIAVGNCTVHFVHKSDASRPNPRRIARTLVRADIREGWFLPVSANSQRLWCADLGLGVDLTEWEPLNEPKRWVAGRNPIVAMSRPLTLEWVPATEIARRRRVEASAAITHALDEPAGMDPFDRVALVEHADGILGGHPITLGALLHLSGRYPGDADDKAQLAMRLRASSPSGLSKLDSELRREGFERLRERSAVVAQVKLAALQAFDLGDALREPAWGRVSELVLWNWWVRARVADLGGRSVDRLAAELAVPSKRILDLMSGRLGVLEFIASVGKIPTQAEALSEVAEHYNSTPSAASARTVVSAALPRFVLFARQLGELERAVNQPGRLAEWEDSREMLHEIARAASECAGLQPWERARIAAELVRDASRVSRDPMAISRLAHATSAEVAGGSLCYGNSLGVVASAVDAPPVVGLPPRLLRSSIGRQRFAIAHQLGHLIQAHALQPAMESRACWSLAADEGAEEGEDEAFANAFAIYVLAPRASVRTMAGSCNVGDLDSLLESSIDVSTTFGVSLRSAVIHVLNCLDAQCDRRTRAREVEATAAWADAEEASLSSIGSAWSDDAMWIGERVGAIPDDSAQAALERPRSRRFEELARVADERSMLRAEVRGELLSAVERVP